MKKSILIVLTILNISMFSQCPVEGGAKNAKDAQANKYKNREITSTEIDTSVTLDKMLAYGEDSKRFNQNSFIKIIGYLVEVKQGGKESCNCGTEIDSLQDIHIYIGKTPTSLKSECLIVEITPRFKHLNKNTNLKPLKGKLVNVYGWLFFDDEHHGNARNTCKVCTNVWRVTSWEIHPITRIELH